MAQIILLNKPFNVLCQFTDSEGRPTLADYIDTQRFPKHYAAGRLDYDSEGLLILTDNGALQHRIAHPDSKLEKTYWVQVEGEAKDSDLQRLRQGIQLNDGLTQAAKVRTIDEPAVWPRTPPIRFRANRPTQWLELRISEGKNRQVRRMTAAVGLPTLRLIRAAIGSWSIDGIASGEYAIKDLHLPTPKPTTNRIKTPIHKEPSRNKKRKMEPRNHD